MTEVSIVPATVEQLEALTRDPAEFAELVGSSVPAGWPEFPESIGFTIEKLREHPEQAGWWFHLFLDGTQLVGSGGFVGPPTDGVVEIGYEIAPEFRGRGYATAAAEAMVAKADADAAVTAVIAHTLAHENPSTAVLRRVGFSFSGELDDEEQGTIWRWERILD